MVQGRVTLSAGRFGRKSLYLIGLLPKPAGQSVTLVSGGLNHARIPLQRAITFEPGTTERRSVEAIARLWLGNLPPAGPLTDAQLEEGLVIDILHMKALAHLEEQGLRAINLYFAG